uniref:Uncharacterized protein n=1 Tax=Cacopsylla melanoneura TaxID=428564 RepID=A0A8D8WWA4_9HEMI
MRHRVKKQREEIERLREEVERFKQLNHNARKSKNYYKVKLYREQKKNKMALLNTPDDLLSPRNKAKKMLAQCKDKNDHSRIAKKLTFHETIMDNAKEKYKNLKKSKDKSLMSSIFLSRCIRKYRLKAAASRTLGLSFTKKLVLKEHEKQLKTKEQVESFFLREDVSRFSAGIKETKTFKGVKKQKRYLLASMKQLHKKYLKDNDKISYVTFTRYKPFYVCPAPCDSRDTCLCRQHVNIELKARKLKELNQVDTCDLQTLIEQVVCNRKSQDCMYQKCEQCKDNVLLVVDKMPQEPTKWQKWDTIVEEREKIKGNETIQFKVKVSSKITERGTVSQLGQSFNDELSKFKKHVFNIKNQYKAYRTLKENLHDNETVIHIDFSENYMCKYSSEIQSFHFGASRKQATIHTGVLYLKDKDPISFASVSNCLDHGPNAIWAHLKPVLEKLKRENPQVQLVHFFSDGPATQYKQKKSFYLFCTKLFEMFQGGTWNFFESSHGKGAPDGVGGALKRVANEQVGCGKDIPTPETLFEILKENSNVELFFVDEKDVDNIGKIVPTDILPIQGTREIHQMMTNKKGVLQHRKLSCCCDKNDWIRGKYCDCVSLSQIQTTHFTILPGKKVYNQIYSSSDSEMDEASFNSSGSSCGDLEDMISADHPEISHPILEEPSVLRVTRGTHVLMEFLGGARKKTKYRYVGVCQTNLEDDEECEEVLVMSLNVVGEGGSLFKVNEKDTSYIKFDQILGILPTPKIQLKGDRVFYKFPSSIDVFEKG